MAGIPQNMSGRLSFNKILGIVTLTAVGAIALGALVALNYSESEVRSADAAHIEETRSQNSLISESFSNSLERVRSLALAFLADTKSIPTGLTAGPILHFTELEVRGDLILSVRRAAANPDWKQPTSLTGLQDTSFEAVYLKEALSFLNLKSIRERGIGLIEVKEDHDQGPKFLGLAFYNPRVPGAVALALVDPVQAFPIFRSMSGNGSFYRAYLLGQEGSVLAHSQSSYIHADFSALSVFKKMKDSSNETQNGVVQASAIDLLPTISSWSKIGNLPLSIVVERVDLTHEIGFFGKLRRVALTAVTGLGVLIALLVFAAKVIVRSPNSRKNLELPIPNPLMPAPVAPGKLEVKAVPRGHDVGKMLEQARLQGELAASERIHKKGLEEKLLLERFEADAEKSREPKVVAERMAAVVARFCKSPTLYFQYQESTRLGILCADSGFDNIDAPSSMTFPITAEVITRLQGAEDRNEWLSLTEYPPLARAVMTRMGVAHFEAWPVCGRKGGKSCLLGVLVILQAGVDSDLHRDSIARMMRATGLTYENSLVSR